MSYRGRGRGREPPSLSLSDFIAPEPSKRGSGRGNDRNQPGYERPEPHTAPHRSRELTATRRANNANTNHDRSVCPFFAQGRGCKYGDSCKNLHVSSTPQVALTVAKERGKILQVFEERGFGFLVPNDGSKKIYYRISDVEGDQVLKPDDEVEFNLTRDRAKPQEFKAINIKLLGRVSISRAEGNEQDARSKEDKADELPSFKPAWMKSSTTSTSLTPSIPSSRDSQETSQKPPSKFKPKEQYQGIPREKGIIHSVKDSYGFIKSPTRTELIFYHINEVEEQQLFHEGDEVDFLLVPTHVKGKENKAVGVRLLQSHGIFGERLPTLPDDVLSGLGNGNANKNITFQDKRDMLDWIREMSSKDGEMLVLYQTQLETLLNQDELPFSVIQPLLSLLTSPSMRNSDRTDKIYGAVLGSKFLSHPRNLRSYILKLSETKPSRTPNVEISRDFQTIIQLMEEMMDRLHVSYLDLPLDALHNAAQKMVNSGVLAEEQLNHVTKLLQIRKLNKSQSAQQYNTSEWTPEGEEEDFRDISVFPSTEEILSVKSGELADKIRPNIVDGKYRNVMHYLDTHFRLLREDCLQPLREGIKSYIASIDSPDKQVSRDIRVYFDVVMKGIQCTRTGIVYRISFRLDREIAWERSKHLMYGSLLCLSCDNFKTLLWATVANRDVDLLKAHQQIDIRFPSGYEPNFSHENVFVMAESSTTYFEAYQHVLKALQSLDLDKFAFADYLINCNPDVQPPAYLRSKGSNQSPAYDFANVFESGINSFPVLGEWPLDKIKTSLDDSQMAALKQALTKELAIIQGPPGTGKTFGGLKVMRALLDNKNQRSQHPILVICYTNHALDQFLEGILEFEDNIVRIGGRSKSEKLKEKNIRKLVFESGKTGKQHHRSRLDLNHSLDNLAEQIQTCVAELNKQQLTIDNIRKVATPEQLQSLIGNRKLKKGESGIDIVNFWMKQTHAKPSQPQNETQKPSNAKEQITVDPSKGKKKGKRKQGGQSSTKENINDNKPKEKKVYQVKQTEQAQDGYDEYAEEELDDELITNMQLDRMVGEDDVQNEKVLELSEGIELSNKPLVVTEELIQCKDVWALSHTDRHRLYRYWLKQYYKKENDDNPLAALCERYEDLCRERKRLEEELQIEVLSNATVIGVTTTGVAKFQSMIQAVKSEVIIVEEAAEVLEAHIVTALSPSTKHVVLIGDHEQLRPSTAVYRLSVQYNLDVSLFERLVRNGIEQITLSKQRRMRPAISSLIKPIYPNLENHPRVSEYPNVMGVATNIFFLHHTSPEANNQDSCTKFNEHEALFITRFAHYLTLQGYKNDRITVLTAYSGQVHLLRKEFRKMTTLTNIRITSVDNFQGEENDIIILSLVRSNKSGEIGFLKASNRICVALSRAKHGLFVMGNADLLTKKHKLWNSVIENFKRQGAFGTALKLQCQNHPETFTTVSAEADFKNAEDGGCNQYCKQKLVCGHVCPRLCHPYSHDQLECYKPCSRKLEGCNHPCNKRCFEECGECAVLVEKKLPCDHVDLVPCGLPPAEYTCTKPCETVMKCKIHKCPKMCGERCSSYCHASVEKDLSCGHSALMECGEDESKHKCLYPCLSVLSCGHNCIGNCTSCNQGTKHQRCMECLK